MPNEIKNARACEGAENKFAIMQIPGGDAVAEKYVCPMLVGERRCYRPTVVIDNSMFNEPLFHVCSQNGYAFLLSAET